MSNLQRYEYFGEVSAVKIAAIHEQKDGGYLVIPAGDEHAPIEVSDSFMGTNKPEAGGYYIVWPNGFAGYMAADAFANCYRLLAPAKAQGTSRTARELAIQHMSTECRDINAYLGEVDRLARYIETGDVGADGAA